MFPKIDPEDVGFTGLLWLLFSYGYVLYIASNFISEGSDLLMLIPSVSGLVGSVVLPLLGAVPDGAIMLFSGLGDIDTAQETLSVGVGALAGSTIMLLTVPWSLCVFSGRVQMDMYGKPMYSSSHKLKPKEGCKDALLNTGVAITDIIMKGALIMGYTTLPYFLIQIPASYLTGQDVDDLAGAESIYALIGFLICIIGFIAYLIYQFKASNGESNKLLRAAVMKKMIQEGQVSLDATIFKLNHGSSSSSNASPLNAADNQMEYYTYEILLDQFRKFDVDNSGFLDFEEMILMFKTYNMKLSHDEARQAFAAIDENGDGKLSYPEIVKAACYISEHHAEHLNVYEKTDGDQDDEVEDMPEDIASLPPEKQQAAIAWKAIRYLTLGTILVLVFSDPMVDVLQEFASRINIPAFYVSFVLAPVAANASEIIASMYYARKKTSKSITVALSALEGAACMNNTFCLSILLGLIYFRHLAWQYTAETISIIAVQLIIVAMTRRKTMRMMDGFIILSIFPLSILLIAVLEYFGLD